MTKRNGFVELMRFIFSLMVVGYHLGNFGLVDTSPIFNFGFYAVEFFFILSGFLLAKSIEKQKETDCTHLLKETGNFIWKKIKSFLPWHIIANIMIIIVIAIFETSTFKQQFIEGLPTLFLVQMLVVWTRPISMIVPEWYLSAMIIVMLITYPLCRLFGRKVKGIFGILIMFGIVVIMLLISGFATNWTLFSENRFWNLQQLIRSFGEILLGMLCYHASVALSKANIGHNGKIAITITMIMCYVITFVFMNLPSVGIIPAIGIPVAIVFSGLAVIFNFSGHDLLADKCNAKIFGYLGAISLPIYLLHPVIIRLFIAMNCKIPSWCIIILVFTISIGLSIAIFEIIKRIKQITAANKAKKEPPQP